MNKNEYYNSRHKCYKYYKLVQKLIKDWKTENNITERCVVHHRDDTEGVRAYNEAHYELWGFEIDENGNLNFKLGKYVQFMTHIAHSSYHNTGENHPMYGKHHTEEARVKMSESNTHHRKGKHHTEEARVKISTSHIGKCHSDETKTKMRISHQGEKHWNYGHHTSDETKAKISLTSKGKHDLTHIKFLYTTYKNNGGIKKWNDFQKALKSGDITFEMQTISVFINGGK